MKLTTTISKIKKIPIQNFGVNNLLIVWKITILWNIFKTITQSILAFCPFLGKDISFLASKNEKYYDEKTG